MVPEDVEDELKSSISGGETVRDDLIIFNQNST